MEDLSLKPIEFQQRVEACKVLYLEYQGRHHDEIQREMREMGHTAFNRRVLYTRNQRGTTTPGWPVRFGWMELLFTAETQRRGEERENWPQINADRTEETPADFDPRHPQRLRVSAVQPSSESDQSFTAETPASHPLTNSPSHLPGKTAAAATSFLSWLKRNSPPEYRWDWKYQQYICEKLERFYRGEIKRLMVFVPPRHGKSELVTVRFSAWCLRQCSRMNIIIGSYNQKLANRFSRKIKNVYVQSAGFSPSERDESRTLNLPRHDAANCPKCIEKAMECPNERRNAGTLARNVATNDAVADRGVRVPTRTINTDAEWETADGGGVRAVGVGAGITGFGADLIIVDDPVKSRAEAESQTMRDNLWNWFNDDLYTRLEPEGQIILIQTRWHEDDLAGRLLREMREDPDAEQWEVIELPAFAEPKPAAGSVPPAVAGGAFDTGYDNVPAPKPTLYYTIKGRRIPIRTIGALKPQYQHEEKQVQSAGFSLSPPDEASPANKNEQAKACTLSEDWLDELGRRYGEALCPGRYDEKKLNRMKRKLGTYSFSALYQQRPTPAEGGFFKRHWFKVVDNAPQGLRWKRGYDLGISARPGSDYTATARVAFDRHGDLYIDRVYRQRWEYPEQRRAILGLIRAEHDTEHFIEQSANGNAVIQDLGREPSIRSRNFKGVLVKESKTARAFTWNALAEAGRVYLVRGAWNKDFIDEACSFPNGTHDDQIDAVSIAVKTQVNMRSVLHAF